MSPIWVKFLGNWGEITLKIDRFHEAFTQHHKRVCHPQKIYPRSPKNLHGYIRHIRDIFQLCTPGSLTNVHQQEVHQNVVHQPNVHQQEVDQQRSSPTRS